MVYDLILLSIILRKFHLNNNHTFSPQVLKASLCILLPYFLFTARLLTFILHQETKFLVSVRDIFNPHIRLNGKQVPIQKTVFLVTSEEYDFKSVTSEGFSASSSEGLVNAILYKFAIMLCEMLFFILGNLLVDFAIVVVAARMGINFLEVSQKNLLKTWKLDALLYPLILVMIFGGILLSI